MPTINPTMKKIGKRLALLSTTLFGACSSLEYGGPDLSRASFSPPEFSPKYQKKWDNMVEQTTYNRAAAEYKYLYGAQPRRNNRSQGFFGLGNQPLIVPGKVVRGSARKLQNELLHKIYDTIEDAVD